MFIKEENTVSRPLELGLHKMHMKEYGEVKADVQNDRKAYDYITYVDELGRTFQDRIYTEISANITFNALMMYTEEKTIGQVALLKELIDSKKVIDIYIVASIDKNNGTTYRNVSYYPPKASFVD